MKKLTGVCVLVMLALTACYSINNQQKSTASGEGDMVLKDIVFNKKSTNVDEYTVYIQEDGQFEPFLVIESNYDGNGNMLLLRKYLLDERVQYGKEQYHGSNSGYYPNSVIDSYLNNIYYQRLSSQIVSKIVETDISVSTVEAVAIEGGEAKAESVKRKIFLLSATELNIKSAMATVEGVFLSYFKPSGNRIATYKNGEVGIYWLRSAYHWDDHQAWTIGEKDSGYSGLSGYYVSTRHAVRPAFCLSQDTAIYKGDVDGKKVYIIEN